MANEVVVFKSNYYAPVDRLTELAAEINALEADRKTGNRVKTIAMGHKLIAVREILREQNGEGQGCLDVTGHRAPKGWTQWVKENLTIGPSYGSHCIQEAVNPGIMTERSRTSEKRHGRSVGNILGMVKKAWPLWTEEKKQQLIDGVVAINSGEDYGRR